MRNMNQRPNCDACSSQYNDPLRGMPLAMAYVPWQTFENVMEGECALRHGTIFEDFVFPFEPAILRMYSERMQPARRCLMTNEQHQLLMYIDQISFALDDTVLFLDTHPCDTEALAYYQELKEERKMAMEKYASKFGPLQNDNVKCGCSWSWVETPWPWESEGRDC